MNKKTISIVGITITIIVLACTAFAAVSTVKETRKLSGKIDEIQQRQEELSSGLQKIAANIPTKENGQDLNNGSKNEDETKDWEVYRNEKYGYTIKYPGEIEKQLREFDRSKKEINVLDFLMLISKGDAVAVRTCSNPLRLSPENFYLSFINKFIPNDIDIAKQLKKTPITINSFLGIEFINSGEDGNYRNIILQGKDPQVIYMIDYPLFTTEKSEQENKSMRDLFSKIFSTFSKT